MKKIKQKPIMLYVLVLLLIVIISWCQAYAYPGYPRETFNEDIRSSLNPELDYLILVNRDHPYDFSDYQACILEGSLVEVPDIYGQPTKIESATYIAFTKLQTALAEQGIIIGLYSAYRTRDDQQWVCDHYGNTNSVMRSGYSEHHTGLVISFLVWHQFSGDGQPTWGSISSKLRESTPEFQIIYDTLADYGFIERYPAEKEYCTGVPCEPCEIRFVGDSDTAHIIMDNDYALEEYLGYNEYLVPEDYYESGEYYESEEYYYPEESYPGEYYYTEQ